MSEEDIPAYKPGSRPSNKSPCTYSLGYVRQDVYSCSQCSRSDGKGGKLISGFCVGCKTACHGDHLDKVIDLYSKRYFRCDCGNQRMKNTCDLDHMKTADNPKNSSVYNHNFSGTYCRCDREYNPKWGDMLQCAICEDWFHEVCLKTTDSTPSRKTTAKLANISCELICAQCCDTIPLLDDYFAKIGLFQPDTPIRQLEMAPPRPMGCIRPPSVEHEVLAGKDRLWPSGFRLKLCKCTVCKSEYARLKVEYITERVDFVNLAGIPEEDLLSRAPDSIHDVLKDANVKIPITPTKKKTITPKKRSSNGSNTPTRARKKKATATPIQIQSPARNSGRTKPTTKYNNNTSAKKNHVPMLRHVDEDVIDEDEHEDVDMDEDVNDHDYIYNCDNSHINGDSNDNNNGSGSGDDLSVCSSDVDTDTDERWKNDIDNNNVNTNMDEPLTVVKLTDEERDRIRAGVTSFIDEALQNQNGGKMPDKKMVKRFLVKLRDDILSGHS